MRLLCLSSRDLKGDTAILWRVNPLVSKRCWDDGVADVKPCHCPLLSCRTPKWTQNRAKLQMQDACKYECIKWFLLEDNLCDLGNGVLHTTTNKRTRNKGKNDAIFVLVKTFIIQMTWRARPETKRTFLSHSRLVWNLHLDDINNVWKWQDLEKGEGGFYSSRDIYKWTTNARRDPWHPSWPERFSPPQYDINLHPLKWISARMCKNVFLALRQGKAEVVLWL